MGNSVKSLALAAAFTGSLGGSPTSLNVQAAHPNGNFLGVGAVRAAPHRGFVKFCVRAPTTSRIPNSVCPERKHTTYLFNDTENYLEANMKRTSTNPQSPLLSGAVCAVRIAQSVIRAISGNSVGAGIDIAQKATAANVMTRGNLSTGTGRLQKLGVFTTPAFFGGR